MDTRQDGKISHSMLLELLAAVHDVTGPYETGVGYWEDATKYSWARIPLLGLEVTGSPESYYDFRLMTYSNVDADNVDIVLVSDRWKQWDNFKTAFTAVLTYTHDLVRNPVPFGPVFEHEPSRRLHSVLYATTHLDRTRGSNFQPYKCRSYWDTIVDLRKALAGSSQHAR